MRDEKEGMHTCASRNLERVTSDLKSFPYNERLDSTKVQALEGIVHTETVLASVLCNFIEEDRDQFLLLNELDVLKDLRGELNSLKGNISILIPLRFPPHIPAEVVHTWLNPFSPP